MRLQAAVAVRSSLQRGQHEEVPLRPVCMHGVSLQYQYCGFNLKLTVCARQKLRYRWLCLRYGCGVKEGMLARGFDLRVCAKLPLAALRGLADMWYVGVIFTSECKATVVCDVRRNF